MVRTGSPAGDLRPHPQRLVTVVPPPPAPTIHHRCSTELDVVNETDACFSSACAPKSTASFTCSLD
jgi:hypothetical protein